MQKVKVIVTLVLTLSVLLMSVSTAAAGGPTGSWASGIACQNLDSANAATVTLSFYREGSATEAANYLSSIPAGSSKNWLTTSSVNMPGFPTNFIGSGVVSSSTQLACNVNTQSTGVGTKTSPYRMGTNAGVGSAAAAPVMYIPQVVKAAGGWNSYVAVQNTSVDNVTVAVHYYLSTGAEVGAAAETAVIPGQSTKLFYQSDNAGLPTGFNGGAKVQATSPADTGLAVVVALYKDGTSYSKSQFYSYNGAPAGANKVFVPRFVRKLVGNNSGLAVQNVSTTASTLTAVFNFDGVSYTVHSGSIAPGASWLLYAPSIPELSTVEGKQGSVVITADDAATTIIASVNEDNNDPTAGTRYGQGATYNAILDGEQSNTVFFAQFTKYAASVFSSGFQVSNTTDTDGTCNITYTAQTAINETNVPLPANGSIVRFANSGTQTAMKNMVSGYNAAVKVVCTVPVTGIVNMAAYGGKYGDSFTQTTGLNQ